MLHKGSNLIEEESATLADMNIFPGDVLWVRDSEKHENRDIAGTIKICIPNMMVEGLVLLHKLGGSTQNMMSHLPEEVLVKQSSHFVPLFLL